MESKTLWEKEENVLITQYFESNNYQYFLLFPECFQKGLSPMVFNTTDFLVKGFKMKVEKIML